MSISVGKALSESGEAVVVTVAVVVAVAFTVVSVSIKELIEKWESICCSTLISIGELKKVQVPLLLFSRIVVSECGNG